MLIRILKRKYGKPPAIQYGNHQSLDAENHQTLDVENHQPPDAERCVHNEKRNDFRNIIVTEVVSSSLGFATVVPYLVAGTGGL